MIFSSCIRKLQSDRISYEVPYWPKHKVGVKSPLCIVRYHAMKACEGMEV